MYIKKPQCQVHHAADKQKVFSADWNDICGIKHVKVPAIRKIGLIIITNTLKVSGGWYFIVLFHVTTQTKAMGNAELFIHLI